MKIGEMFPSKWLKAEDADDGDIVLTITKTEMQTIGQGAEATDKPVIFFEETEKGLVLNKTNSVQLSKLYGNDSDDWVGKQITLFATEVQFGSEMVAALRVRSKAPKPPKARAASAAKPAAPGGFPGPRPDQIKPADDGDDHDEDLPF